MNTLILILTFALFVIAGGVALGLMNHYNMWWFICLYWLLNAVKIFIEFFVKVRGM